MPSIDIVRTSPIIRTPRVMQVEGIFDVPPTERSQEVFTVNLEIPDQWNIGLIVGPSGSGKTTIAEELWPEQTRSYSKPAWSPRNSVLDDFPDNMPVKEIVELLCSVGFSSPPSWLRPFHVLSTGEKFRVEVALALAKQRDLAVIDEFTSVVDRDVAKIASAAVAKTVRRHNQKLIAVSCHYDILNWLDPDWVYDTKINTTARRLLQGRPEINLDIHRCSRHIWPMFRHHHYLSSSLNSAAVCFVACWGATKSPSPLGYLSSGKESRRLAASTEPFVCPTIKASASATRFLIGVHPIGLAVASVPSAPQAIPP